MDRCLSIGGSDFPFVIVNVNWWWFRFFAGDDVVYVHGFQNEGHSLFPWLVVKIGE